MSLQTTLLSGKKRLTSWNPCRSLVPAVGKAKEADEGFGEPNEGPIEDHPKGGRSEIPPRWAVFQGEDGDSVIVHEKWTENLMYDGRTFRQRRCCTC